MSTTTAPDVSYPGPPLVIVQPKPDLPSFPDINCSGDCGFEQRGFGWQCVSYGACGRYLHPGDKHFDAVDAYYRAHLE